MTAGGSVRTPRRWYLAWLVLRVVPDIKGRARLFRLVRGRATCAGEIEVALRNGVMLRAVLPQERHIWFLRGRTPVLGPLLDHLLDEGDLLVDIGANIGLYSCWGASRVGPTGRVLAFEPVPETRDRLAGNISLNGYDGIVEVRGESVGADVGVLEIYYVPGAWGLASSHRRDEGAIRVETRQTTLDAALDGVHPKLVKIDVEGHEFEVLSGAREVLAGPNPPMITVEIIDRHLQRAGHSAQDLLGLLEANGYEVFGLTSRGLVPWRDAPTGNALALRPEHAAHRAKLAGVAFGREQA